MRTSFGGLQRVSGLRLSLLASLGLLPAACGGNSASQQPDQSAGGDTVVTQPPGGSAGGGAGGAQAQDGHAGGGVSGALVTNGGASPINVALTASGDGIASCESPTLGTATGLVDCANGYSHRPTAVVCPMPPSSGDNGGGSGEGGGSAQGGAPSIGSACASDADCAGVAHGYCRSSPPFKVCASGCATDSDCESGRLCYCGADSPSGTCMPATCRTDADCGAGRCAKYALTPCGDVAFACQKADDHCGKDICDSCAAGFKVNACGTCGRPFLVNDEARTAAVVANGNWLARDLDAPALSNLSPSTRALLAAHWSRLGQMEHASIAAFARFNLQLLSLGAPAELVELCTQALADETEHTKLCFALASHYAGTALGPSRLDVSQALDATSLLEIMSLVLNEGCIGETCAALEAAESAELARDPALKRAYARIAQDEQRHAELAFRFLRWAYAEATRDERAQFVSDAQRRVREFAGAETAIESNHAADSELASQGVLGPRTLSALRRSSALDVTWPLLETLLASNETHSAAAPTFSVRAAG